MSKYIIIFFCSLLITLKNGLAQEFLIFNDPVIYFTYDRYDKSIFYRDFFSGAIYKTGIDSSYRSFFLPDGYTDFKFFNHYHELALSKFVDKDTSEYELYFFDFLHDSLVFKNHISGGILISPSDKNILILGDEPTYYSVLHDRLKKIEKELFIDCCAKWKNDSSFFFIQNGALYLYNYSTSTIDTIIFHEGNNNRITSIAYNQKNKILAYGLSNINNNQVILRELSSGTEQIVYDKLTDDIELSNFSFDIKDITWSPDSIKIAFFLIYHTISASDIVTYNSEYEKWKRHTGWDNNYGVKYNLTWINQDTILYEYDSQVYAYNLNSAANIETLNYPKLPNIRIFNYPNPFNTKTQIFVKLPITLHNIKTYIEVYNMKGQLIQQLHNFQKINNTLKFTWNSQNVIDKYIASGIYFVNVFITTSNRESLIRTHKVLLIK